MINRKKGFTLIELLAIVVIIGILAAIAVPQYHKAVERARIAKALPLFKSIFDAQQRAYLELGEYPIDVDLLDITVPYDTKQDLKDGRFIYNSKQLNGYFAVYTNGALIVFGSNAGYTIDLRKTPGTSLCYPSKAANNLADSLCASLGTPRGAPGSNGITVYILDAW